MCYYWIGFKLYLSTYLQLTNISNSKEDPYSFRLLFCCCCSLGKKCSFNMKIECTTPLADTLRSSHTAVRAVCAPSHGRRYTQLCTFYFHMNIFSQATKQHNSRKVYGSPFKIKSLCDFSRFL